MKLCHQQEKTQAKSDQRRIGKHFLQFEALAAHEEGVAVSPEQQVKGDLKSAAVKDHFISEGHADQRKDQIAHIGVCQGGAVDRVQIPDLLEELREQNAEEH